MATIAAGGSLTAASPLLAFQTQDAGIVGVEVSGTWTGTVTFEARIGNTWANAQVFTVASVSAAATTTANVSRLINAAGFSEVRANFSTPTSGSPTVIFTGSPEAMGGGGGGGGGGGAATIADGADVAEGTTADAGIITDTSGTVIGFLRGAIIQWAKLLTQTGIVTETAPATDTASSGLNGRLQRIAQRLTSLIGLFPTALGTTTAANSLPVTLASDGTFATLEGAVTETAPATDTASSGLNGRLQRIAQRITSMIALLPASLGGKAAASSLAVTLATDEPLVGILTETAPATDTASSGLNGRLQRVAQRLTSLIALLPSALVSGRLDVNLGAAPAAVTLGAGTAVVGNAGGIEALPQATFTRPADTNTYAANDAINNSTSAPAAMTFANAATRSGQGGFVIGATIFDEANQTLKLNCTLHLFSAVPVTLTNDNAALALANADYANYVGTVKFTQTSVGNAAAGASGSVILTGSLNNALPYKCAATSLFGILQADNAYVPVSGEVFIVQLNLSLDA